MAGLVFGLSWLVPAIHALPGPRKTNFGPKRAQNCTLFMKTIEENQSLKPIQFVN
jgi:hypothetical protein